MSRPLKVFLAGILAILPLAVTVAVFAWAANIFTEYAGPQSAFGQFIISLGLGAEVSALAPYFAGLALIVVGIYVLGLLVQSSLWSIFSAILDGIMRHIPVVSNVYEMSKRFVSIVDTNGGDNLKSMVPVWCFFGGEPGAAVLALMPSAEPIMMGQEAYLGILVPSAPVPVGGALIYVPKAWVKPAEGGMDHLMSVYVSMGVTPPKSTGAASLPKPA